ncbi:MAG: hypothetical protein FWD79_06805 [Desulfobulbus sp.]|nr:hypothetical protein [Desulfobulbus sp.]
MITGFNDIFVVIACVLFLASVAWIGATSAQWVGAISVSVMAWILAEFFIRKRRMALPAIVLTLAFAGSVLACVFLLLKDIGRYSLFIACAFATVAAWLHWLRFRVPITIASGVAVGLACMVALLIAAIPEIKDWMITISLLSGVAVFALVLRWDATDTARQTRRSDVAFWLHILAAPLLVHPMFASLGVLHGETAIGQAMAVIALYIAMAVIALCIDRRALMVSALAYVLYAFSTLLKQHGVVSLNLAIAALAIGSALLLLSAFWHTSRTHVLRLLPLAVQMRLPPLR